MNNAGNMSCEVFYKPEHTKFSEGIRMYQGCPTIAVTKGGRIYLGWYAGGLTEPHMDNYNLLVYSDDQGKSWSKPLLIIPSSYEKQIHALDIQLFVDPEGALHVLWVQNNVSPDPEVRPVSRPFQPLIFMDGYMFHDFYHNEWEVVCQNPDADEPVFSKPRYLYQGFLRCKPTFLENGDWLCFAYDQMTDRYGYSISQDQGKTFTHHYGAKKLNTYFDEAMAFQMEDGTVRMYARNGFGELAMCDSKDQGRTWTEAVMSGIVAADTRFYVKKLPSGRVLLIINEDRKIRKNMTLCLSEDDGKSWKYKTCIDAREGISYPDADYRDGRIYLTYDRGRTSEREIFFTSFTENDIIEKREIKISIVSKPLMLPTKQEVIKGIEEHMLIAILRGVPGEKLIPVAEALYRGGIRLLEITYDASGKIPDVEVAERIKMLVEHFKGRMYIGAGTVLTKEQVWLTRAAGGLFIISPNSDTKIIKAGYRCGLVTIPGAYTPTEVAKAQEDGADFIKLFPVTSLGVEYVKAIKAPLSHVKLLAVGGITRENMAEYVKAGVAGFGISSGIADKDLIACEDYEGIAKTAKEYMTVMKNA